MIKPEQAFEFSFHDEKGEKGISIEIVQPSWFTDAQMKELGDGVSKMAVFLDIHRLKSRLVIEFPSNPKPNSFASTDGRQLDPLVMKLHGKYSVCESLNHIAHEMVHVKQMLRGELFIDEENTEIVFKGERHPGIMNILANIVGLPHKLLPWETEAYEKQDAVFYSACPPRWPRMQKFVDWWRKIW